MQSYLAVKNQEMARVGRMIDDVPARSELIQYERRFVELYEQISAKVPAHPQPLSRVGATDPCRTWQMDAALSGTTP